MLPVFKLSGLPFNPGVVSFKLFNCILKELPNKSKFQFNNQFFFKNRA